MPLPAIFDRHVVAVGIADVIADRLEQDGVHCLLAADAFDAGIHVAAYRPAVLIVDASIGRARAISLGRSSSGIACVISLAGEDDMQASELYGIVLRKPVDCLTLVRIIGCQIKESK